MDARLIVGLGNPGEKYKGTRHNLGFLVVDKIAEHLNLKFKKDYGINGLTAHTTVDDKRVYVLKPLTYVNHSGMAVASWLKAHPIDLSHTLVLCDDVHLPFGHLRLKDKGSDGGHNGLASVIEYLKTKNFSRLRLGVGGPPATRLMVDTFDPALGGAQYHPEHSRRVDFVLGEFNKEERKQIPALIQAAMNCCLAWINQGVYKTMGQFNRRVVKEDE